MRILRYVGLRISTLKNVLPESSNPKKVHLKISKTKHSQMANFKPKNGWSSHLPVTNIPANNQGNITK